MDYLFAVGVTVGVLAGVWMFVSGLGEVSAFAGFLGWASYFAAGGGKGGAIKALCSNMSGVFWGVVFVALSSMAPQSLGVFVIAVLAAIMCWQAKISPRSFIPGTFIGNACFYANNNNWPGTTVGLLCGIALGLASEYSAKLVSKKS